MIPSQHFETHVIWILRNTILEIVNVSKNMPENKSGDWLADTAHHIYFWHGYVVLSGKG